MKLSSSAVLSCLAAAVTAHAQNATPFVSGLRGPIHVHLTPERNLLVAESGTAQEVVGRVSLVTRSGERRTIIDGLPSGMQAEGFPLGVNGVLLHGRTLYAAISDGDSFRFNASGRLIPNPEGISSPIFSSIIRIKFDADVDQLLEGFTLTRQQHFELADGHEVTLTAGGRTAVVDIVVDFRDFVPDPDLLYRQSNPYRLVLNPHDARRLYLLDAGMNTIIDVDTETGRFRVLARFPRLRMEDGRTIDPVPTSLTFYNDDFLVTLLGGFPFPRGVSSVQFVSRTDGRFSGFINGLSAATDVIHQSRPAGRPRFYVLEFGSLIPTAPGPGRLLVFDTPDGESAVTGLTTPSSMVLDGSTGELFIAERFAHRILRVKVE